MKNKAKCKLCSDIIESKFKNDFVKCSCGQIWIDGGEEYYRSGAEDYRNFLRIDEEGNEIEVTFIDQVTSKDDLKEDAPINNSISALEDMILRYESLPDEEMRKPVSQYDLYSFLLLFREMLKS